VGFVTNWQDATIGWHVKFVKAGSMPAALKSRKKQYKVMQELESCHWYCKQCDTKLEKIIPTIVRLSD